MKRVISSALVLSFLFTGTSCMNRKKSSKKNAAVNPGPEDNTEMSNEQLAPKVDVSTIPVELPILKVIAPSGTEDGRDKDTPVPGSVYGKWELTNYGTSSARTYLHFENNQVTNTIVCFDEKGGAFYSASATSPATYSDGTVDIAKDAKVTTAAPVTKTVSCTANLTKGKSTYKFNASGQLMINYAGTVDWVMSPSSSKGGLADRSVWQEVSETTGSRTFWKFESTTATKRVECYRGATMATAEVKVPVTLDATAKKISFLESANNYSMIEADPCAVSISKGTFNYSASRISTALANGTTKPTYLRAATGVFFMTGTDGKTQFAWEINDSVVKKNIICSDGGKSFIATASAKASRVGGKLEILEDSTESASSEDKRQTCTSTLRKGLYDIGYVGKTDVFKISNGMTAYLLGKM